MEAERLKKIRDAKRLRYANRHEDDEDDDQVMAGEQDKNDAESSSSDGDDSDQAHGKARLGDKLFDSDNDDSGKKKEESKTAT